MSTTWDFLQRIFLVAGGLGLFLYGMTMMSDGLQNMSGDRMRKILERATNNPVVGVLVGAFVTAIIQSSSATTVMLVGFVNAGLMNLTQAIGVIMGANIGTTVTALLISFKIDDIAPLLIFLGLIPYLFFKKNSVKNTGFIVMGLGILFFGIKVMGDPLKAFAAQPGFQAMLTMFENPVLALLAGAVFTGIIQSSSATTGIIVAMYLGGVDIPFVTAVYIIMGCNIGTCVTALIASIPANRESKRAALAHFMFNVFGSVLFGTLFAIFPGALSWIQRVWPEGARQVAMFHIFFNTATTVIVIWFVKPYAHLIQKMLPERKGEVSTEKRLIYLDASIMKTPTLAVPQAHRELCRMGRMAEDNLRLALDAFYEQDASKAAAVVEVEDTINFLNHQITAWLVRFRGLSLSPPDLERLGMMLHAVSDIERLGDHAENVTEYVRALTEQNAKISPEAMAELKTLSDAAMEVIALALDVFDTRDEFRLPLIDPLENRVDDLTGQAIENHIRRLKDEVCDPRGGVVFTDMVIDLERCADHATNIAYAILGEAVWDPNRHAFLKVEG